VKWSFRAGSLFGISVYIHWTFLILLAWIGTGHLQSNGSLWQFITGVLSISVLFGIVLLHELGHSLMARRFGIETKDITLLPIGGVAQLERMPDKPWQEFWVALAGPAVNVVLAIGALAVMFATGTFDIIPRDMTADSSLLDRFYTVNVFLVLFNMLPAFPMDGGRVLRAILAMRLPHARATRIAANIGQAMALVFVFFGLMGNFMLLFIALFVWLGAESEANFAQVKSALGDARVRQAMITRFRALSPMDTLSAAVEDIVTGFQQDFLVVDDTGRVVGILTYAGLIKALTEHGPQGRIGDAMTHEFETCGPDEPLEHVMPKLQASPTPTFPVIDNGGLIGMLTLHNLSEFVMVRGAIQRA